MPLINRFFAEQRPHAGALIVPRSMPTSDVVRIARALRAFAERHENQGRKVCC